jgi:hypothetical protein
VPSIFKHSFIGGAIVALVLGLWLAQLWSAENQVRLHSEHFLRQIEKRKAAGAGAFLAPNYHDDWGHDRELVLDRLRMVLRVFSSLTLTVDAPQVALDSPTATWSASIRLEGAGGEFAPEIIGRVNSLTTPFELQWQRESWRPWDWKLVQVSNPTLRLSGRMD